MSDPKFRLLIACAIAGLIFAPAVRAQEASPPAPKAAAPKVVTQSPAPSGQPIFGQGSARNRVSDAKAVAIVDRYLQAIGGQPALDSIKDRKVTYVNTLYQAASEAEARITLLMQGDYKLREEWSLDYEIQEGQKLAFVQIYNGDAEEGWVQVMGRVDALDGKTLLVFVHNKFVDDFFCHWKADGYVMTLVGEQEVPVDGGASHETDVVQVVDFSGRQTERYFFSRDTGLILKKEWTDTTRNPKKPIAREQFYKRYRNIPFMDDSGKSIKVAMLLEIYGDGDLDTERRFESVAFNVGLEDELFERPEGAPGPKVTSSGKGGKPKLVDPAKDASEATTTETPAGGSAEGGGRARPGAHPTIKPADPPAPAPEGSGTTPQPGGASKTP